MPHRLKFYWELLDYAYESTEKLVAPILAVAKKYGATIASDGWSCAYKAKAGILQNETVRANAAKMPPESWYEMYVKPWHPELATVGMCVLSHVISASVRAKLVRSRTHSDEDPQQAEP